MLYVTARIIDVGVKYNYLHGEDEFYRDTKGADYIQKAIELSSGLVLPPGVSPGVYLLGSPVDLVLPKSALIASAKAKLTKEEQEALGL